MISPIAHEFIEKVYWENPDDPDDNGYAHVCNRCGDHGQTQEWADDVYDKPEDWDAADIADHENGD